MRLSGLRHFNLISIRYPLIKLVTVAVDQKVLSKHVEGLQILRQAAVVHQGNKPCHQERHGGTGRLTELRALFLC
ncbi:unnamed protein product [Brugia pahangi]|uniref:Secreted protein n=1 Tax=Brugia pahangi TaxID=6280 RepID=A0A0N4TPC2_BRUPA|nr:unnamed protein product [Brugia pahangi]